MKKVTVEAEFVNLVPPHQRFIVRDGEGTTVPIAIKRAVDEIFSDPRLKRKRTVFPIKLRIEDGKEVNE